MPQRRDGTVDAAGRQGALSLRRLLRGPAKTILRSVLPHLIPSSSHARPSRTNRVRVVGMLSSSSGLGMSARLCAESLRGAGFEVETKDVSSVYAANDGIPFDPGSQTQGSEISIYHLNPPKLLPGLVRSSLVRYHRTFNVGYWAWELETLPPDWIQKIRFVDAVMVPSTFCRTAIQRYTDKPVLVVPHAVHDPALSNGVERGRNPDPTFRVLTIFSYGSSFSRKNPIAAIKAFRQAFADRSDVHFLIKVTRADAYPVDHAHLLRAASGLGNVSIVDEIWDQRMIEDTIAGSDAYISLHRSEGFGLTLAEAIMAGVPVVATDWSGNVDFCDRDATYPVRYDVVPFRDDHPDFGGMEDAVWADPSVEDAARQLRRIHEDRDGAQDRAVRAREFLRRHLSSHTYADAMNSLFEPGKATVA